MIACRAVLAALQMACVAGLAGCNSAGDPVPLRIVERSVGPELSGPRHPAIVVDTIVLHFSSDVLARPQAPFDVQRILEIYRNAGVSAHYLIHRDGTVYRLVPEARVAFHARSWNPRSIGIELLAIGSAADMARYMDSAAYGRIPGRHLGYTAAQYDALGRLIMEITARHRAIQHDRRHIVGHDEIDPQRKSDPGELFEWSRIGLPAAS